MRSRGIRRVKTAYPGEEGLHRAVALGYDPERDQAPRVLASGQGVLADQIIALARAKDIPIREDPILAAALAGVEIDTAIPPELYALVAEVLAYVYHLRGNSEHSLR